MMLLPTSPGSALRGMVRQLSIDQFENESRRVSMGTDSVGRTRTPIFERMQSTPGIHKLVLRELLHPRTWRPPEDRSFVLTAEQIMHLCNDAEKLFAEEPTVLQLEAPIKIFGDLHGQFGDLMRLFEEYGTPSTAGDITYIDYLFLGDYVDRGAHSLVWVCGCVGGVLCGCGGEARLVVGAQHLVLICLVVMVYHVLVSMQHVCFPYSYFPAPLSFPCCPLTGNNLLAACAQVGIPTQYTSHSR